MASMEKNGEDKLSSSSSSSSKVSDDREGEEHTTRRNHTFIRHRKTTTIIRRRLTKEDSDVDNKGKNSNTLESRREAESSVSFLCGLSAGILQALIFNPFDRALYLSITNEVPFLRQENFRNPYNGFLQSVGHRALSSGLYYPLENFFCCSILPLSRSHSMDFVGATEQQQQQQQQRLSLVIDQKILKKLEESMKRSQKTRNSLLMKTPRTEGYSRTKSITKIISSIESSSCQLNTYLQTIQRTL